MEFTQAAPTLPPPSERQTAFGWARRNLFRTWYDALLTLLIGGLVAWLMISLLSWIFTQANWEVIQINLRLLMVGQYPTEELWRLWLLIYLLAVLAGLTIGIWAPRRPAYAALLVFPPLVAFIFPVQPDTIIRLLGLDAALLAGYAAGWWGSRSGSASPRLRRLTVTLWVLYLPVVLLVVRGSEFLTPRLPPVPSNLWGGLLLTFLLTVVGIVFSFPLGVLLALGRRSSLPVIRWVSVTYIEVVRGVPLVTILFMASVMVPLFLPGGLRIDRVLRAMVGIIIFTSAYMAENVRGGLQSIPRGQYEAAQAVGLGSFHTLSLIILPQALRAVIPVIMGLFIALFKDTSLVATIGLLELLGISRSILAQPAYVSYQQEVLLFISLIYWVISYFMSYVSRRLEIRLGVGER